MPPKAAKGKAAATAPSAEGGKLSYAHTTPYQIRAMVEWLEIPENHDIITGNSTKNSSVQHGAALSKLDGYKLMAAYVHTVTLNELRSASKIDPRLLNLWTPETCRTRWTSYHKKYSALANKVLHQTGFGVPTAMAAQGITLEKMLEMQCPFYHRIDKLFGHLSNMQPRSAQHEPLFRDTGTPSARVVSASEAGDSESIADEDDGDTNDNEHEDDDDMFDFSLAQPFVDDGKAASDSANGDADGLGGGSDGVNGVGDDPTRVDAMVIDVSVPDESTSDRTDRLLQHAAALLREGEESAEAVDDGGTARSVNAVPTRPTQKKRSTRKPSTLAPALATRDMSAAAAADAKGVEKAQNAKRKDFGSVFVESASKRLALDERRLQAEAEWRERQHTAELEVRKRELDLEEQKLRVGVQQKQDEERNKLAIQLLLSGMDVQQVKETVNAYFETSSGSSIY